MYSRTISPGLVTLGQGSTNPNLKKLHHHRWWTSFTTALREDTPSPFGDRFMWYASSSFFVLRIISHPRNHRTEISTQDTSLLEFMTSTPTLMMQEKSHRQCYTRETVLSKYTPLHTGTSPGRVGFISCFHRKNSATKVCCYLKKGGCMTSVVSNHANNQGFEWIGRRGLTVKLTWTNHWGCYPRSSTIHCIT